MRYGENDAVKAEKSYFDFRKQSSVSPPTTPIRSSILDTTNEDYGTTDAIRKYMRQHSDVGTGLLKSTSALEPITTSTQVPKQQV
jgi:hypothetical protein